MRNQNMKTTLTSEDEEILSLRNRISELERKSKAQKRKISKLERKTEDLMDLHDKENEESNIIYDKLSTEYDTLFKENLENVRRNEMLKRKIQNMEKHSRIPEGMCPREYEQRAMEILSLLNPDLHEKIQAIINPRKRKSSSKSERPKKRRRICSTESRSDSDSDAFCENQTL